MIWTYVFWNLIAVAWFAWLVHRGLPAHTAIIVGSLGLVMVNVSTTVRLRREKGKPKPLLTGQFPWRAWRRGNALAAGILVYFSLKAYGAADLAAVAVLMFGVGNLSMVVSWLRDRDTLRHRGQSAQWR